MYTVSKLQRKARFLRVPDTTDALTARVGPVEESLAELRSLGILVDRDEEGYLLQIFSKPWRSSHVFSRSSSAGQPDLAKHFKALFDRSNWSRRDEEILICRTEKRSQRRSRRR